ncbi:hypothetical protein BS47DRAFT_1484070 [Hydnum rufescens UP504]|uniref:Uncharacterized protein n=1 Tax=Hydnum rufescens UP504 TaxID=1448309 RepID=A0A9P6DZW3_9AGAM|nr:hypothetical protein BS47DRAFT_1484070 [Hydnum rufescens UP504]
MSLLDSVLRLGLPRYLVGRSKSELVTIELELNPKFGFEINMKGILDNRPFQQRGRAPPPRVIATIDVAETETVRKRCWLMVAPTILGVCKPFSRVSSLTPPPMLVVSLLLIALCLPGHYIPGFPSDMRKPPVPRVIFVYAELEPDAALLSP